MASGRKPSHQTRQGRGPLSCTLRAKLAARAQLVAAARDLGNQLRGFLRGFGLVVGKGKGRFEHRVLALVASCAALQPVADALLATRRAVLAEVECLDRVLIREARQDVTCQRLMTVPGVGPITALAYMSTMGEPMRFGRARDVGAYLGLVPRRHQSGEVDRSGRISKSGDALLRGYLYEAATVLISRLQRPCALRAWARALAERIGVKKARVALARKPRCSGSRQEAHFTATTKLGDRHRGGPLVDVQSHERGMLQVARLLCLRLGARRLSRNPRSRHTGDGSLQPRPRT